MRLASVKAGDVVRVDGSPAYVIEKPAPGRLVISWAGRDTSRRTVGARDVDAAWRRIGNGTPRERSSAGYNMSAAHDVAAEYNRNKRPEDPPMWVATL